MSAELQERLNQILSRITSAEFVSGAGIGNERDCSPIPTTISSDLA